MAQHAQLSDRELLRKFAQNQDETAFRVLVERHGALVFRVCKAVLRRHHDAEDAFQATFLVLAKKAGKVSWRKSIGNWLYSTAYRISLKASARVQRERGQPMADQLSSAQSFERLAIDDAERTLHEELNQLHEQHRIPLVLCYLQGMTYGEAANVLGLTMTTVNGRLQRARHKLRLRLLRRGIGLVLPAAAAGPISTQAAGAATSLTSTVPTVSEQLLSSTVRASTEFASGGSLNGLLRPEALILAKGETAMISSTIFAKQAIAGAMALTLLVMSCLLLSGRVSAQTPQQLTVLEAQIPPEHIQAQRMHSDIANLPSDRDSHQGKNETYSTFTRDMRLVGSRETNVVSIFSVHTGRWHKQPYKPLPGEDVNPVIGEGVVVFKAGDRIYGFSGRKGVWDSFEVQVTGDVRPRLYDDWAEVEVDGVWWAFSAVAPEPRWARVDLAAMD